VYAKSDRRRNRERVSCVRLPWAVSYLCDESLRRCTIETIILANVVTGAVWSGAAGFPLA
jgi:hypothetical protein